jgi:hypothetical protein
MEKIHTIFTMRDKASIGLQSRTIAIEQLFLMSEFSEKLDNR